MSRFVILVLFFVTVWSNQSKAEVCENASSIVSATAAAIVLAPTVIESSIGVASLAHSSGAYILTGVGIGGGGYIAGTLGSLGATALGVASSPVVVTAAVLAAVGGAGLGTYCYFTE